MIRSVDQAPTAHKRQALEARFGLRLTAALERQPLPHDIEQRLRVSRELALSRALAVRRGASATPMLGNGSGTAILGGTPWWLRLASFAPLMVLALGLLMIQRLDSAEQIRAAAEIDAVLLADELPPRAYTDPGFAEYLKQAKP